MPDGFTVDGAGHTITAHDVSATVSFIGAVVTNAGTSMHLRNLTVRGTGFPNVTCDLLAGIQFADADGSVSNVTVLDITRNNSCVSGNGLRVNAVVGRPHRDDHQHDVGRVPAQRSVRQRAVDRARVGKHHRSA